LEKGKLKKKPSKKKKIRILRKWNNNNSRNSLRSKEIYHKFQRERRQCWQLAKSLNNNLSLFEWDCIFQRDSQKCRIRMSCKNTSQQISWNSKAILDLKTKISLVHACFMSKHFRFFDSSKLIKRIGKRKALLILI